MVAAAPRKGRDVAVTGTAAETVGSATASAVTRGFAKVTCGDCAKTMAAKASPTEIRIFLSLNRAMLRGSLFSGIGGQLQPALGCFHF